MSSPDAIDARFDELVRELRSGQVAAPPELRERVRAIATREPEPPLWRARRLRPRSRRRALLVLAPLAAAVAAGAAVVVGVVSSGDGGQRTGAVLGLLPEQKQGETSSGQARVLAPQAKGRARVPVPSTSRAQLYEAELRVRVRDLSASTKRALRLTRGFGGYVRSVDYGSGPRSGTADLVVRIPVGRVQEAIVRFSALGKILDQHVSIQDVQPSIDRRFRRLQALRGQIASLQARLARPGLTQEETAALEAKLAKARSVLTALQREQARAVKQASFATVSLGLRTKEAQVVVPHRPGRLERALDRAADVLVRELEILLYVLVVAAPFAVLAALAVWGRRAGRRRAEERLLAR